MPNVVYSTRFIGTQVTLPNSVTVTVPTGFVWVVRSISISTVSTGVTGAAVSIPGVTNLFRVGTLAQNACVNLECRHVLNAGEQLSGGGTGTGGIFFMVSGYQLTAT